MILSDKLNPSSEQLDSNLATAKQDKAQCLIPIQHLVDETIVPSNVSFVSGDKDMVIKGDLKNVFDMDKQNSYGENFIFDVEMEITPNIFEDYFSGQNKFLRSLDTAHT